MYFFLEAKFKEHKRDLCWREGMEDPPELPSEVWFIVFELLSAKDIRNCLLVNRRWWVHSPLTSPCSFGCGVWGFVWKGFILQEKEVCGRCSARRWQWRNRRSNSLTGMLIWTGVFNVATSLWVQIFFPVYNTNSHHSAFTKLNKASIPLKQLQFTKQLGKSRLGVTWLGRYRNVKVVIKEVNWTYWNSYYPPPKDWKLDIAPSLYKLHHRNIVQYFGYSQDPIKQVHYYVFEFLESKEGLPLNLKKLLRWVPPDRFRLKLKVSFLPLSF